MKILIDGDACPKPVKEVIFKASSKKNIQTVVVAAGYMSAVKLSHVEVINVPGGPDAADDKIVELTERGDLVITADIPLAGRVVEKEAYALNPRGTFYDESSIKEKLSMRNFMEDLRSVGVETGGPSSFNVKDKARFANALDRFLTKHL